MDLSCKAWRVSAHGLTGDIHAAHGTKEATKESMTIVMGCIVNCEKKAPAGNEGKKNPHTLARLPSRGLSVLFLSFFAHL